METYISRIISVFSCKWFGGRGGRFNTLPPSMNNSIIWIKWTPGGAAEARRRAVDPLPLPTSLFPSLSLSFPSSLRFHSASPKCHTLVTLVSLRQKLAPSWKKKKKGRNSYQSPLRFGKVIWKSGVRFQGKLPIKYSKKIKWQCPRAGHCWY